VQITLKIYVVYPNKEKNVRILTVSPASFVFFCKELLRDRAKGEDGERFVLLLLLLLLLLLILL